MPRWKKSSSTIEFTSFRPRPASITITLMKIASLFLVLCAALPLNAQTLQVTPQTREALIRLGGQLMIDGKAYEYDRQLADEIGPRLTGSDNYVKAAEYAKGEFTRLGLNNVHFESWTIPATWEPDGVGEARMIKPHQQRLHMESEGWSQSTNGEIRGELFHLKAATVEAVKADATKINGHIVFIDGETMRNSPQQFGKLFDGLMALTQAGAKALILGFGTTNDAPSYIGLTNFDGSLFPLPAGNLGEEDTLLLGRLLKEGPVEVEFNFKNKIRQGVPVNNVVAEIPGTDPSSGFIVIGGHLDSWHPGTGAQDNGTGASSVLAIAQAIQAAGLKPRRTIRFILFGGEEEGLIGSIHYARDHAAEMDKCAGVFVTDSGSEPPKGWYTFGRADVKDSLALLSPLLASLGAAGTTDEGALTFETDEAPFLIHGVPSLVLWTPMDKYWGLHHKPSDTFDKVVQRDLNLGVAVVGVTAYAFADAPNRLKQLNNSEMEDELKGIKALDEYKDMNDHKLF